MRRDRAPFALRHALALGLVQGPSELLPVSSSAHTILIPLLAGWPYEQLEPELRKSFEVALHAGAGAGLAVTVARELTGVGFRSGRRRAGVIAMTLVPPALAGAALERIIERRLGGPRSSAAGLAAGALAMALADARAADGTRAGGEPTHCDGLAIGLAEAAALAPGVSRNGAALTAARARGFSRPEAHALSWQAALPVIVGASVLKGVRVARHGLPAGGPTLLAVGGASAFLSTIVSARVLSRPGCDRRSLLPYALYRGLLAAVVARRS